MRSIFHRVLTLGLIGGSVLGSIVLPLTLPQKAQALTQQEVSSKLASIPAFIVANSEGAYITSRLVGQSEDGEAEQEVALLYVFFSGQDAEEYLTLQQQENPNFAPSGVVGWVELAALYQQAKAERDVPLRLLFVPQGEEVSAAVEINGDFASGVPVFLPRYRDDGSYMLLPIGNLNDGEPIVPAFFSQQDIETTLAALAEARPEVRDRIEIEVVSLESLISQMETADDDNLNLLYLLPDSDAINYIRAAEGEQQAP
ncbi:MAG: Tic22 family protein [Cyanobacteria bacterium P01_A01_bin.114]